MKLIYILCLVPFFWVQAYNNDYSKIETLINQNSTQLLKGDKSSHKAEDRKLALDIASKIQSGECPEQIEEKLMSYAIKNLASKSFKRQKAEEVVTCIETLGIKKDEHYTLMVDLLPFWKSQNTLLELFYSKFFKGYKKVNVSILGLLDNAKLMCVNAAVSFLKKDKYPENYDKVMTDKEYFLFQEYVKNYRCEGY